MRPHFGAAVFLHIESDVASQGMCTNEKISGGENDDAGDKCFRKRREPKCPSENGGNLQGISRCQGA